ncbi:MAG: excinuclease ABC subunit UvrA [Flavobacteriales bacterium]|nr:excinuclease ABC subunit UvrA [Flavobacteriales bacterium]MCX7768348.1 excinuclease ABC subunit UvrA [Flavobacteriales bacterium]MDW8409092.1 excinuclease ABC subunit UvrA [Flavobacteriales bacterium]
MSSGKIEIYGAREHNLKNIDLYIPHQALVVFTGLSGSGKSSLAFNTLYAEGQRRYLETFSAYARQFIGGFTRPDVDKIKGLSPVVAIEQKSTNTNPRSTVGTVTELYHFIRLLFARASQAFSSVTGEPMVRYTEEQICQLITSSFDNQSISILAPLVLGRKGHYRELLESVRKAGFEIAWIDGKRQRLTAGLQLDRYKTHDIYLQIDTLSIRQDQLSRIQRAIALALKMGKGRLAVRSSDNQQVRHYSRHLICPTSGISYPDPAPNFFSFNSPYGACPECNGLGETLQLDIHRIIPDFSLSIRTGILSVLGFRHQNLTKILEAVGRKYGFTLDTPLKDFSEEALHVLLYGTEELIQVEWAEGFRPVATPYEGLARFIQNIADNEFSSASLKRWAESFMSTTPCKQCKGSRLRPEALYFRVDNKNIHQLATTPLSELRSWFEGLPTRLPSRDAAVASEIVPEILKRLTFILDVGLGYLELNRPVSTLSGGEMQRLRLATQVGSQLTRVLYILDEPSIGLHLRDNHRLIQALKRLRDNGNTVIVVEHDRDMIEEADFVVDLGPGAGTYGGHVVACGPPQKIKNHSESLTGKYLSGKLSIPTPTKRRPGNGHYLELLGASGHNLRNVDLRIPLGTFTVVTGVSGSGKSSLINDTLRPALMARLYKSTERGLPFRSLRGTEHIDKVISVDQSPIGRTPRSNPATYTGVFSEIRNLFAQLPEARVRGYKPGRFSFNVKGGRCEECQGAGIKTIEMNFLPDVQVTCDTCQGRRYNRETLEVRYKGRSISDILEMEIHRAVEFFENIPSIARKLQTLQEIGLGYLRLGQQATTLSGGEAQRVKLAAELNKRDSGRTLYLLDEPTTGLHFEDVRQLLNILHRLVDKGNTVLVIEHNREVITNADYIIDLGPEAGEEGGKIIFAGTPEEMVLKGTGYTAQFLRQELKTFAKELI